MRGFAIHTGRELSMQTIYFDITDVALFSEKNHRVNGIPRVQLRLITDIIKSQGTSAVKGLCFFEKEGCWKSIDLGFLKDEREFNATNFLLQIDKLKPSRFPPKNRVKHHLSRFSDQKILRTLKKIQLYIASYCNPAALEARWGVRFHSTQPGQLPQSLDGIQPGSTLVILGNAWSSPPTSEFALKHKQNGGRVVQMIHDIIPAVRPDLHARDIRDDFNTWLADTTRYVERYLCVSENTGRDLRAYLAQGGHDIRVEVTPLAHEFPGYPRHSHPLGPPPLEIPSGREFVLCVGSLEIRKNGGNLVRAWHSVVQELGDAAPLLVFAGKRSWALADFDRAMQETRQASGKVLLLESPSDTLLATLYQTCLFTVYPSLYEGWGLPIGESAWFDKYGVVSHASSIPEVCGPLMDYVDPLSPDDIAQKLLRPLQDRAYLAQRHAQVQAAPLRTWLEVAQDVHAKVQAS